MSQHVDPDLSFVALDGDAYRAPVGTPIPTGAAVLDDLPAAFMPYGGVEAGLQIATAVESTAKRIWNGRRGSVYRTIVKSEVKTITLRVVEHSEATVKTIQRGGGVVETEVGSGVFKWEDNPSGAGESFMFVFDVKDGDKILRYFFERVELTDGQPPQEVYNGEDLVGWDISLTVLSPEGDDEPYQKYSNFDPTVTVA